MSILDIAIIMNKYLTILLLAFSGSARFVDEHLDQGPRTTAYTDDFHQIQAKRRQDRDGTGPDTFDDELRSVHPLTLGP